jgi:hypothetical protein
LEIARDVHLGLQKYRGFSDKCRNKEKKGGPGWVGAVQLAVRGIIQRVQQELG